ncbi:prepilin-type N-terminal cleavage/methylation domain-containing protein [Curvibacter sp. CHRR-16]|uniref:PulJ/GspJ family protein n=1 Tax=Curvibacter sp. CHRR-16 TaxID=2835872 RepID=UPI001BDAF82E|nr:prepilin-type N-terminal cleavage/methylation domain-containing protein [Curvibacter sp. CHRR-16]MBT0569153.1 prepilin-type N-terminal cleavage/methylation domain-containing protein [Curvibacter sp. CHRR-16]
MRKAAGFTLLEVLVALSIMALLTAMGWRTLSNLFQTLQYTRSHDQSAQALHMGFMQWRADLQAMSGQSGLLPLEWNGKTLFITRRSANQSGWNVVAWSALNSPEGTRWERWSSPPFSQHAGWQAAWQDAHSWANGSSSVTIRSVAIAPLVNWQVYFYRGNSWSNAMSSIGDESLIPDGIRLQLDLPAQQALQGAVTLDWVRPQINPALTDTTP